VRERPGFFAWLLLVRLANCLSACHPQQKRCGGVNGTERIGSVALLSCFLAKGKEEEDVLFWVDAVGGAEFLQRQFAPGRLGFEIVFRERFDEGSGKI